MSHPLPSYGKVGDGDHAPRVAAEPSSLVCSVRCHWLTGRQPAHIKCWSGVYIGELESELHPCLPEYGSGTTAVKGLQAGNLHGSPHMDSCWIVGVAGNYCSIAEAMTTVSQRVWQAASVSRSHYSMSLGAGCTAA